MSVYQKNSILLVEDEPLNRVLLEHILKRLGLKVHVSLSGEAALSALSEERFDLIFMDISLPGMDGMETSKAIRLAYPDSDLPIIATTAYTGEEKVKDFLASGMSDYLKKPVNEEQLRTVLKKHLS